jgi:hypothetical protein
MHHFVFLIYLTFNLGSPLFFSVFPFVLPIFYALFQWLLKSEQSFTSIPFGFWIVWWSGLKTLWTPSQSRERIDCPKTFIAPSDISSPVDTLRASAPPRRQFGLYYRFCSSAMIRRAFKTALYPQWIPWLMSGQNQSNYWVSSKWFD